MANFCTNCGQRISNTDNFCPYCGTKVTIIFEDKDSQSYVSKPVEKEVHQTKDSKNGSIKARNFYMPILIMFVGGWIGGFIGSIIMPNESVVRLGTILYLVLSGLYIYSCHDSLSKKHSSAATSRSIIVLVSGFALLVLAFFTIASDNLGMALVFFFVALGVMILDSILDSCTPNND